MTPIIEVKGISKVYRIGQKQLYYSLRDQLARLPALLLRPTSEKKFWGLKDISFKVYPGDVVGIIGRNGAGKTTLLKIISQITPPSKGEIRLRGRVASLLEIGTGFHPELTGRENIFLNGAILGMRRSEISAKFSEIVEFSEVEKFLDTPVKHYSYGMYLRLAFSVAAHLDPEILLIDEVLSVGDAGFQKKCLGKMQLVAKQGRTIIFVSHNMGAINSLCNRCLLVENGKIISDSTPAKAIKKYLHVGGGTSEFKASHDSAKPASIQSIWLENNQSKKISEIEMGEDVHLIVGYEINTRVTGAVIATLLSKEGTSILYSYDTDTDKKLEDSRKPGNYRSKIKLPTALLKEGTYQVAVLIGYGKDNLTNPNASISFNIINTKIDLTHKSFKTERPGLLYKEINWETSKY